jgi:hypothetical protein
MGEDPQAFGARVTLTVQVLSLGLNNHLECAPIGAGAVSE